MATKTVAKKDLRNFVNRRFVDREVEYNGKIDALIKAKIDPLIAELVTDLEPIKKAMTLAVDKMETIKDLVPTYYEDVKWTIHSDIRDMRKYSHSGWDQEIRDNVRNRMVRAIRNPQERAYDFNDDRLNQAVTELIEEIKPHKEKLEQLRKLRREVHSVIDNERNGKKAFKMLEFLGIDMSGFNGIEVVGVPAVQNFSVDPCLLNGGCK